jgi:hypothetical protein
VRKKTECQWCYGLGYDSSGQKCVCQPDHFGDKLAWILGAFIAVMVLLITLRAWFLN